jgi:hypothetical protein
MPNYPEVASEREKRKLEIEKLSLEQKVIQWQSSGQARIIEWIKAISAALTVFSVIVAIIATYVTYKTASDQLQVARSQFQLSEKQHADEQFDKVLTRVANQEPNQRMTGVAGLQLFLDSTDPQHQKQTLHFLVNALSLEGDVRVQGAILEAIREIPKGSISSDALNDALDLAVRRNRDLTEMAVDSWKDRINQDKLTLLAQYLEKPKTQLSSGTIASSIDKLTLDQYLALIETNRGPFQRLGQLMTPLKGLAQAILSLIKLGAAPRDFRNIYCEDCDFHAIKNLDNANFGDAYLSRANFSHMSLRNSIFSNAQLDWTNFFSSDLSDAHLDWSLYWTHPAFEGLPILGCTFLSGTDISGLPLAIVRHVWYDNTPTGIFDDVDKISFVRAKIDNKTILNSISIVSELEIYDT